MWVDDASYAKVIGRVCFYVVMVMDDYSRFALTSAYFIEVIQGLEGPDPLILQSKAETIHTSMISAAIRVVEGAPTRSAATPTSRLPNSKSPLPIWFTADTLPLRGSGETTWMLALRKAAKVSNPPLTSTSSGRATTRTEM